MPPTNEPPHRHLKKASPARRKSKPKFEIPMETGRPQASVGWVYRADEVPAAPRFQAPARSHPFVAAGKSMFLIGAGTVGLISLAALGLMSTPVRLTQQLLSSD
jgi:hypothetical protein